MVEKHVKTTTFALILVSVCSFIGCEAENPATVTVYDGAVEADMLGHADASPSSDAQSAMFGTDDQSLDSSFLSDAMADMALPTNVAECETWDIVANEMLIDTLHQRLVDTYEPITPTPNFGGVPDRYTTARELMFTRVERYRRDDDVFVVECIYTNDTAFTPPDRDPDGDDMNCEHLWPRARLDGDRNSRLYEHQQSDLHHLAPSRPSANSLRGSLPFGEVVRDVNDSASPSLAGINSRGERVFEPQDDVKGDIARSLFYMSIRWGLNISTTEEANLRAWHRSDPVHPEEVQQNDVIEMLQGNRNPFIDCPALVERIGAFDAFETLDTTDTLPFP